MPRLGLCEAGLAPERDSGIGMPMPTEGLRPEESTRTRVLVRERLLDRELPDLELREDEVDIRRLVWACRGSTPGT